MINDATFEFLSRMFSDVVCDGVPKNEAMFKAKVWGSL